MLTRRFFLVVGCFLLFLTLRHGPGPTPRLTRAQLLSLPAVSTGAQTVQTTPLLDKDDTRWRAWQALPAAVQAKVDPRLLAELRGEVRPAHLGGSAEQQALLPQEQVPLAQTRFLVYLQNQADFAALQTMVLASQAQQRNAVFALLRTQAAQEQAALRGWLASRLGSAVVADYQPFTIVNAIAVDGSLESIIALAQRPDVARLVANYPLFKAWQAPALPLSSANAFTSAGQLTTAAQVNTPIQPSATRLDAANWNISLVRADRVWSELQVRGEGAVVAGFDTGVSFRHPALVKQYRGNLQNGRFDHNYNWFEPDGQLYADGNLGKSLSTQPRDCDNHGTHTMGTVVGDGGSSGTQVGMAPGAQWIALPGICSGTMSGGLRDDIGGLKAFQWLLCPTDLTGDLATADCAKAPDVVNNSWGSANPTNAVLRSAIQALRAMNIAPVFAAGNPRTGPGSIGSPGNAPEAITVGATDRNDLVAPFSGRGPSFYEGEQKPELSAPGDEVNSAVGTNGYDAYSGTSMAAPHVTGLIALMVSADLRDGVRDFTVDELETFMANSAVDLGAAGPDNDYGYGRIDAYAAVRWVLSAGDLRGQVRSQADNTPLAQVQVTGVSDVATFHGVSNATGLYSVTVPSGNYDVTVDAWGYYSSTFAGQTVLAGALAQADFALRPLPTALLQGTLRNAGTPVANALLYIEAAPTVRTRTDSNGQYQLTLPVGRHTLVVQEAGYRILRQSITVVAPGLTQELAVTSAPSILLVEADAYRGWFEGWPLGTIFTWALDKQGYAYDQWRIQSLTVTDTVTQVNGTLLYGIPSLPTLNRYDVVIWAQSGCDSGNYGCLYRSSPVMSGAAPRLQAFLDGGGRLILSGQDIGTWDDGTPFYDQYLNANQLLESAAREGDQLTGSGFLQSLAVTLTNASLYGYRNGSLALSPDAISAERTDDATYPILRYGRSQAPAALAIDSCRADYRAVYFGVGFENIGPRADNRDPAIAEVLGRAVRWVSDAKLQQGLELISDRVMLKIEPGRTATYQLQLVNTGRVPLTIDLQTAAGNWPTHLLRDGQAVSQPLTLAPCQSAALSLVMTPPASAVNGEQQAVVLTTTVREDAALTRQLTFTTVAFAAWTAEKTMPSARYRLGVVAPPDGVYLYAVGGWPAATGNGGVATTEKASTALERYNVCTYRWEALAALPAPRANVGVALADGKIYVVGGSSAGADGASYQQYASVFAYDIATNHWVEVAPLPQSYAAMAVTAINGKVYAFGGLDGNGTASAQSYLYDPAHNRWTLKAPMPNGPRYLAAAAPLNGEIYVVGGWNERADVEIYDPATDRWRVGPALEQGRHSLGLAAGPDGYLYAVGGAISASGEGSVERYRPQTAAWETLTSLKDKARLGTAAAYAAGQLYAVGGANVRQSVEGLRIDTAFCLSTQTVAQRATGIGSPLAYTVTLYADPVARPTVTYRQALPAKTTFAGFTHNPIGARFNAATGQIEWDGALAARAAPIELGYLLNTDGASFTDGEIITSTAQFNNGAGLSFMRTTASLLLAADLSGSTKQVDRREVLAGDRLTYTIQLQGATFVDGAVTVRDPLPTTLDYIPDTLSYSSGSGQYDPATRSILWTGRTQAGPDAYLNFTEGYTLGDSDGAREIANTRYEWIEIGESGVALTGGDSDYICGLPLGFAFPFYDMVETEFCISTNGFLSFQQDGVADDVNDCPLPTTYGNGAMIAALWDDLVVDKDMRYQTLGVAPNRYLVAQWNGVRHYGSTSGKLATFQVVLFENGVIRVAVKAAGALRGASSTTGIENSVETSGVTYACNELATLHDQQAIVFVPPGASTGSSSATVRFQARANPNPGANVPITNTVLITTLTGAFQRQATTMLNSVTLASSRLQVTPAEVAPGETVTYTATLRNTGVLTAPNATLSLAVPAALSYVDGSLACSTGGCQPENGLLRWTGTLAPNQSTTVSFVLRLTTGLPDRTPIPLVGQLDDGFGNRYDLMATVMARRSDLQPSQMQFVPAFVEPGASAGWQLSIYNAGGVQTNATLQANLPTGVNYIADSLVCGTGVCTYTDGVVQWQGVVLARTVIPLRLRVQTPATAPYGERFTATATLTDVDWNERYPLTATLTLAHNTYLSLIHNPAKPFQLFLPMAPRE